MIWKKSKIQHSRVTVGLSLDESGASLASIARSDDKNPKLENIQWIEGTSIAEFSPGIEKTIRNSHLQKAACVDILTSESYQVVQTDLVDLPAGERAAAARWQLGEHIDYPPDEAVIDVFEIAPLVTERRPLTYAVSARQHILKQHLQVVQGAGLIPTAIDIAEFAFRNICDLFAGQGRGHALLHILDTRSLLAIVRDGELFMFRVINTGMNDILPYVDGDVETLSDQLDMIVLETQRSFDFCESTFSLPTVSKLLVAPTQRELPELTAYLNEYLGTTVEPLDLSAVLDHPQELAQTELNRHLLAIGGALRKEEK